MLNHMSLRLAWHSDGWNGHICKNPEANPYCVGQYSYPGTLIKENRNLDVEKTHAGESCASCPGVAACSLSINAFGKDTITATAQTPKWWNGKADPAEITLPPATACTWNYEGMYSDDVIKHDGTQKYDYDKRKSNAEAYFSQFQEGKSLIFYYAGYSNPFSEDEDNNYVVVGVSRLKKLGDFIYYPNCSDDIAEKYAGGIVWEKPVTSLFPDEGFCIPYWKYMGDEETLDKIVVKPQHRAPFKYASRVVSNDDAIDIINRLVVTVDNLIAIGDTTEDWKVRKEWLGTLLNELWKARGPYPGFPSALENLGLGSIVPAYVNMTNEQDMQNFRDQIKDFFEGRGNEINCVDIDQHELKRAKRNFDLLEDNQQTLLLDIFPRFSLTAGQIKSIIDEDREKVSITASLKDIVENPYIIFEQYVGMDSDDVVPFYKIDNGVISSPEFGLDDLIDDAKSSGERLRALCVNELNRIAAHSFGKASTILQSINSWLDRMPEWKRSEYKKKNFKVDKDILEQALTYREDEEGNLYLYLKTVYEDEREIERTLKSLADRNDIAIKKPIFVDRFHDELKVNGSELDLKAHDRYEKILDSQARTCMQVFTKPLCVISGAAGTGKTTVIKTLLEEIKRVHGIGTGFILMAPTGKATERIKLVTDSGNITTIHSFLAKHGWINENFTFKRNGGSKGDEVNTIIIDECSMINLDLMATLFRAINWNSVQRLILIGDPNQLPPIGRGKVFSDIVDWLRKEFPENIGKLTENIRQLENEVSGNGNGILSLANVFIQERQRSDDQNEIDSLKKDKDEIFEKIQMYGDLDEADKSALKDLSVYYWRDQNELYELIKDNLVKDMEYETGLSRDDYNEDYGKLWQTAVTNGDKSSDMERIQIISPYKGEFYGTDSLNVFMQDTFNHYWSHKYDLDGISFFDKVIQYRNRPKSDPAYAYDFDTKKICQHEVYNGEIGAVTIHPFDLKNKKYRFMHRMQRLQVAFSNTSRRNLRYQYGSDLYKDSNGNWIPDQKVEDNLQLAYAISVHKSQGSEFDYVYIVLPKRDSHLLSMELLYTAITRAQKHVTLFIQDDIGTLAELGHLEKSAVRRINSSVFSFNPLPDDMLYIQNWHADDKKLATLSKYFVRSKSEVIIANMLFDEEIPFSYETPLYASDGTMYLPDFTVKFKGEDYYWEHVGMLDKPDYKAHWEKKKKWYDTNFPGKLLTTYEGNNLSLEAKKIIDEYR